MANKKATIYILNVSETMRDTFDTARDTIMDYLEDKLLAARKTDLASVLLVGTEDTYNILAEETPDQYQHITTLSPLEAPRLELLRTLKQTTMSDTQGDVLDAVIIANQMILKQCRKLKYTKSIVVFTNNIHPIDWLDLDAVADMLSETETKLTIVASEYESYVSEVCDPEVKTNLDNWQALAEKTPEGGLMSLKEAYELTQEDFVKEVRPTPNYRGSLYLGSPEEGHTCLTISIYMYLRTKDAKLPSGTKWSALSEGSSHAVERESKYTIEKHEQQDAHEDETVEKEALVKGFRFGKSIVKLTEEEIEYRKLKTHKEMTIVGFISADKFPRHYLLSNAHIITAGFSHAHESALALKALAHALFESKRYALVRYVSRDDAQPKLGILQPEFVLGTDGQPDTLLLQYFAIAFAEDIRDFKFQASKDIKEHDPKGQEMMDQLVDAMNLDQMGKEYLMPESNFNPYIWRVNRMIKSKALDPQAPVPDLKASFQPQLDVAKELKDKVGHLGTDIAQYYKVKQIIDKKKESRKAMHVPDMESDKNLVAMDDVVRQVDGTPSAEPQFTARDEVVCVGDVTPIEDFRALLNRPSADDQVEYAMKGLGEHVMRELNQTFGRSRFPNVIACLHELRKVGIEEDAASIYNNQIRQVKAWCFEEDFSYREELFVTLKKEHLGLITNEECQDTDIRHITPQIAEKFWNKNEDETTMPTHPPEEIEATNENEFNMDELVTMETFVGNYLTTHAFL